MVYFCKIGKMLVSKIVMDGMANILDGLVKLVPRLLPKILMSCTDFSIGSLCQDDPYDNKLY